MMANKPVNKPASGTGSTQSPRNGSAVERRPSEQLLQVVDRAVGAVPVVADAVRNAVEEWRKPERVEPVYKQRVEPVVRERVEPVYRERLEPAVRKVRERI